MKKAGITAIVLLMSLSRLFAQTTLHLIVNEEPKSCARMMPMTCLQVQKDGSDTWELFYDRIKGFNYVPGFRYEISVIQTEKEGPVPEDLSRYIYQLEKVISVQAMPGNSAVVNWKIKELNGIDVLQEDLLLGFNLDQTLISGKSGCNTFSGSVSISGKKIKTGILASTKMMCEPAKMELEKTVTQLLSEGKFKQKTSENQWIWYKKGKKVLVLVPELVPDKNSEMEEALRKIHKKELHLIELNGSRKDSSTAIIIFDVNGKRFSGNNGCNQLNGAYKIDDGQLHLDQVVSTKMACIDPERQETERSLMKIFRMKDVKISLVGTQLIFEDTTGAILAIFE